jgi:GAF domain-containing protein
MDRCLVHVPKRRSNRRRRPDVANTEIVESLLALSDTLISERTLGLTLARIVDTATRSIPGCDAASVGLSLAGRPATATTSGRVALEVDLAQYDTDEGPCLEALRTSQTIRIHIVDAHESFPHFAPLAEQLGIRSILSVPARWGDVVVGTLNLYSRHDNSFDETATTMAQVLATQIAVAISRSPEYNAARNVIEVAQREADDQADIALATGLLMGNEDCTVEQAERLLQSAAVQNHNTILEIAQQIIRNARESR